ncbi:hypothetical protein HPB51_024533 [Rhipicephalus microplus]|uniref:Uncharacterized protein n=1 Tax=Rhipicephalus microplus TaxID=6941 RepID=A0A9J6DJY6_RHIMP|nr:hypothetical protein HPB51_024533 [Rhipicephalus microplus]
MLARAWGRVKDETIANCFRACGFIPSGADDDASCTVGEEDTSELDVDGLLPALGDVPFEEYIATDSSLETCGALSDAEIVEMVRPSEPSHETEHLSELCLALVRCVGALAVESALQAQLLAAGSLFHLLLSAFHYDYTLREGGVESALETNQQEVANRLAEESITACARLAGLDEACPPNAAARSALSALLTPYLARKLGVLPAPELLRILTANTENPYLLWDNATRAELREYLREQQRSVVRSGECDESYGANFVYSAHKEELVVGEIFVRIYNEQPTFPLENPRQFALDLLDFVGSQAQYLHSARSLDDNNVGQASGGIQRVAQTEQALQALHNVLRNNPGQCAHKS